MKYKCKGCGKKYTKAELEIIEDLYWQAGSSDGKAYYCPVCKGYDFDPCIHRVHKNNCVCCGKTKKEIKHADRVEDPK